MIKSQKYFSHLIFKKHFLVAVAGYLLALQTLLFFNSAGIFSPVLLIVFTGILVVYNMRPVVLQGGAAKKLLQALLFSAVKNGRALIIFTATVVTAYFIKPFSAETFVLLLLIMLLSVGYVMPVYHREKKVNGLRNIPIVKNIVLAFTWALATVLLPVLASDFNTNTSDVWIVLLKRFFFIFSLSVVFDIRDFAVDKQSGLKTIPVIFGIVKSKMLATFALVIFIALSIIHHYEMVLTKSMLPDFTLPLLLSGVLTLLLVLLANQNRKQSFYTFLMDGAMIVQFALVFFFFRLH